MANDNVARLDSLTGLRYLAALMVAVFHVRSLFGQQLVGETRPAFDPALVGSSGVTFFFVLSGFVLTWSHRHDDTRRNFLARRFARIYPTHLLTTVLAAALAIWLGHRFDKRHLVVDVFLVQSWIPSEPWVVHLNSVSWSLSDEFAFYAVFALSMGQAWARLNPRRLILLCSAWLLLVPALMLVALPGEAWFCYFFPLYRIAEFGIGVALGVMAKNQRLPRVTRTQAVVAIGVSWALAGWAAVLPYPEDDYYLGLVRSVVLSLIMMPSVALLIAALARRDIDRQPSWLATSAMQRLGGWSFAFYLIHLQLLQLAAWMFKPRSASDALILSSICIVTSTALAGLIHHTFEQPLERVIRRRLTQPRTQEPASVMSGQGSNPQTKSADQEA